MSKVVYSHEKKARLSIEDPNRPENDISVGSKEIGLIFRCFSRAYDSLKTRMTFLAVSQNQPNVGFLDTIISACYDEYAEQRAHLRKIFEVESRFFPYHRLLTPPPPPSENPSDAEYDPENVPAPSPPPPPPPALPPAPATPDIKIKGLSNSNNNGSQAANKKQKKKKKKTTKQGSKVRKS